MGNGEATAPTKSDKASSPVQEQPAVHPYPDWAAMQAYYGPGVPMRPPYLTAAVASGHAPHPFIWGPQPFMPPYATPYSAIYTHGVYSHPSVPLGSYSQTQGITPFPSTNEAVVMATPLSVELPSKSSGDKGRGLLKKLKGLDGLPVSNGNGNGNVENTSGGAMHGMSQSGESGAECSSEGSDENNESGENKIQGRESSEDTLVSGKDEKAIRPNNVVPGGETNESSKMPPVVPANITGKAMGTMPSSSSNLAVDCRGSANEVKASGPPVQPPPNVMAPGRDGLPIELWIQDERALKREKRKQSNRESARRSRLRKQAETEELAIRVQNLGAENMTLRTEIIRLKENSEKLRIENSALMEKLKDTQFSHAESVASETVGSQGPSSVGTINLLSKVNTSNSFNSNEKQETGGHENATGKLHQLFGPSSRSDAVAAG